MHAMSCGMRKNHHNIQLEIPKIRQLDDYTINRIAAGEVVERPASAVKELIENALDAGADKIEIFIQDGGKTLIKVRDNGHGIPTTSLAMALSRHATSKIDGSDLLDINTFGFRGEALPSMGAVGRLIISSKARNSDEASTISVDGGRVEEIKPKALAQGTEIELHNLFYTTPARLKFLRSDRAETQAIADVVKRLAIADPTVEFSLIEFSSQSKSREIFKTYKKEGDPLIALSERLKDVLGSDFWSNSFKIDAQREDIRLFGYTCLPTYSRGSALAQYLFVNGRPVKDKILTAALRVAYSDFLSRGRHPSCALFIECDPQNVDVNVHPAKAEVRFREPGLVRGLMISAIKNSLSKNGHRTSTTLSEAALGSFNSDQITNLNYQMKYGGKSNVGSEKTYLSEDFSQVMSLESRVEPSYEPIIQDHLPLGAARGQFHENYIISQTNDGIVIVDQHAAHERLVYEKLKHQIRNQGIKSQALLIPEIINLEQNDIEFLLTHSENLKDCGFILEAFGVGAVVVRETPAILGVINAETMIRDILDELYEQNQTTLVSDKIDAVLSRVSCHGSIRSGRRMLGDEMNALLREMEKTPHSGQCNHGRPTYIELKLADIEKLFGRT